MPGCILLSGYRHLPLFDKNGDTYEQALLFVHVEIADVKAPQWAPFVPFGSEDCLNLEIEQ